MTRPIVKKPYRGCKIFYPRFALSSNPVNSHWCLVECGKQLHRLKTFFVVFQPITLLTCATVFCCRRNHFALISKARISTDFKCSACSLTSQMPFCSFFLHLSSVHATGPQRTIATRPSSHKGSLVSFLQMCLMKQIEFLYG